MRMRYSVGMDNNARLRTLFIALLALALTGCATYFQPRYGSDGVYYDQSRAQPRAVVAVDPLIYPYWSLDYFYFSRFYHPHSIFVHSFDPWFYPYPGWYYGYRPGFRSSVAFGSGFYYPWYSFGFSYSSYRPWRPAPGTYRYVTGHPVPGQRVREIDQRLRLMERQPERTAIRTQTAPPRSETMTRHRIAEDRAAASARGRPTDSRHSGERVRSTPTRTPPPRRDSRTEPARSRPASRPTPRQRQQPPGETGIDLSAFQRDSRPRSAAPPERGLPTAPAQRAQQDRPAAPSVRPVPPPAPVSPPPPVRDRPESRPAPALRPPPPPRQDTPPPTRSRDSGRSTRQREIDRR